MIKILFLDIDGVLNDHGQMMNLYCGIHRDKVDILNRIIDATDCKIVISSAWRYMIIGGNMTLNGFEILLLTHGLKCHNRVIGYTPSDEEYETRGQQISAWTYTDDFTYIVVDDVDLWITHEGHPLVRTDGKIGLTETDADKIISYLRG